MPIIGLIYLPYEIGVLSLVLSIASPIGNISTFSFNKAIMLPDSEDEYISLFNISIITSFLICLFGQFFLFFLYLFWSIEYYFLIIPLLSFSITFFSACKDLAIKKNQYKLVSFSMLINSIITVVFIFSGFFLKASFWALILSYIIANIISTIFIIYKIRLQLKLINIDFNKYLRIIKKYKTFPLYKMPANFINTLNAEMPTFFIKAFFGTEVLGNFFIASKIVNKPISIVSEAVNGIIYKNLSETKIERLKNQMNKIVFLILLFTSFFTVVYLSFGRFIFNLIFDINVWKFAYSFSNILIFAAAISAALSHYSSGLLVYRKNFYFLIWEIFTTILLFIVFNLSSSLTSINFMWMYLIVVTIRYLFLAILFNSVRNI
jgi:O-antigen/teichoic acid export membrane protein